MAYVGDEDIVFLIGAGSLIVSVILIAMCVLLTELGVKKYQLWCKLTVGKDQPRPLGPTWLVLKFKPRRNLE